jgi:hypothetical protein
MQQNLSSVSPTALNTEISPNLAASPLDDKLPIAAVASSNVPIVGQPLLVYDGSTNKLPDNAASAPNAPWFYYQDTTAVLGGSATPSTTGNGTKLATNNIAYAGYINYKVDSTIPTNPKLVTLNSNFPTLDPTTGYIISFTAQVESETSRVGADKNGDKQDDRAGFSVIVIDKNKKGIELGFWSNRIWAQNDGTAEPDPSNSSTWSNTLFTQGEGVDFNTKTQAVKYDLAITGNTYSLFADNNRILTGNVRDYTPFKVASYSVPTPLGSIKVTPPDPYEQPNFVFFGDNTPTAGATVNLNNVKITTNKTIANQTINFGESTSALPFKVADVDNDSLTITATSNNTTLIANSNIQIGGTGTDRTITVNSGVNQSGTAKITLTIDDGKQAVTRTFDVTVSTVSNNSLTKVKYDFDGDKKADILWRNTATGENAIWLRDGFKDFDANSQKTINSAPIGWDIVGTGDLDGDGKDDIVWRNQTTGENAAWFMDSFKVNPLLLSEKVVPKDWQITGIGYFDNDKKADIVWRNQTTGEDSIWLMDGAQIKQARFIKAVADKNWKMVAVSDSNGDGKDEILWRNQATGDIALWFVNTAQLDGDKFSTSGEFIVDNNAKQIQVTSADWKIEAFADYNGDGKADLLWQNRATGETALWWLNSSTATRTESLTSNGSIIKVDQKWEITL